MKSSFLRRPLWLACGLGLSLALAACGGKATFEVKGTIEGLQYDGMVLTNNGANDLPVPAKASSFAFPGSIEYGTPFNVVVKKQPDHQSCNFGSNTEPGGQVDTAGRQVAIKVVITCLLVTQPLGGSVTGLTADGLVLINGSNDQIGILKDATTYNFASQISYGTSYGISVLTQPTGLKCTVANPNGVVGDAAITNVNVSCVPAT